MVDDLKGRLLKGNLVWNAWREMDSKLEVDLSNTDLKKANLWKVNLSAATLIK